MDSSYQNNEYKERQKEDEAHHPKQKNLDKARGPTAKWEYGRMKVRIMNSIQKSKTIKR